MLVLMLGRNPRHPSGWVRGRWNPDGEEVGATGRIFVPAGGQELVHQFCLTSASPLCLFVLLLLQLPAQKGTCHIIMFLKLRSSNDNQFIASK